jgi:hypothetical protein
MLVSSPRLQDKSINMTDILQTYIKIGTYIHTYPLGLLCRLLVLLYHNRRDEDDEEDGSFLTTMGT